MWLSLGPLPHSRGQPLRASASTACCYEHVPGFDGLRVPARYAMIAALFLSIAAGYGVAVLEQIASRAQPRRDGARRRVSRRSLRSRRCRQSDVGRRAASLRRHASSRLPTRPRSIDSWRRCRTSGHSPNSPSGIRRGKLRYVYYSTVHWKRLVNGYSGGFPRGYKPCVAALLHAAGCRPRSGLARTTRRRDHHVIVHSSAFCQRPGGERRRLAGWHTAHGCRRPSVTMCFTSCRRAQADVIPDGYTSARCAQDPLKFLSDELDSLRQQGLYRQLRVLESEQQAHATFDHKSVVNLSSNNYLGLTTHPRLREAALEAVRKYGAGLRFGPHHRRDDGAAHGARARGWRRSSTSKPSSSFRAASPPMPAPSPRSSPKKTSSFRTSSITRASSTAAA